MKRNQILALGAISLSLMLSSCYFRQGVIYTNPNASPAPVSYHYWYYPSTQVYYDYQRRVYFYNDSGSWYRAEVLPPRFSPSMTHVALDMNSDKPYVDFEKHRMKYPPPPMREQRVFQPTGPMDHPKDMKTQDGMDHRREIELKKMKDRALGHDRGDGDHSKDMKVIKDRIPSGDRVMKDKDIKEKKRDLGDQIKNNHRKPKDDGTQNPEGEKSDGKDRPKDQVSGEGKDKDIEDKPGDQSAGQTQKQDDQGRGKDKDHGVEKGLKDQP